MDRREFLKNVLFVTGATTLPAIALLDDVEVGQTNYRWVVTADKADSTAPLPEPEPPKAKFPQKMWGKRTLTIEQKRHIDFKMRRCFERRRC